MSIQLKTIGKVLTKLVLSDDIFTLSHIQNVFLQAFQRLLKIACEKEVLSL